MTRRPFFVAPCRADGGGAQRSFTAPKQILRLRPAPRRLSLTP